MSEEKTIVYSRDGEVFYDDEGIIQEARNDWEEGESEEGGYYSGEQRCIDVASLVSDWAVGDIIESMDQALYDICGEVSEDALSITKEKKAELQKIITNFMKENCTCSCFAVDNVEYHSFMTETPTVQAKDGA